jgi:hypothetical protein
MGFAAYFTAGQGDLMGLWQNIDERHFRRKRMSRTCLDSA